MKFLLGKKVGMTQIFDKEGRVIPVTLVEAGPITVTAVRTENKNGYPAVQVGFDSCKKLNKPLTGHLKNLGSFRYLRECRIFKEAGSGDNGNISVGDKLDVTMFKEGDIVNVSGINKAKGFQGVVKRHGFRGGPASHGQKHSLREPGSIGATFPERVIKGKRMAGRMGGRRVTVRNLTVVKVDKDMNVLAIKGALPGRRGTVLEIKGVSG